MTRSRVAWFRLGPPSSLPGLPPAHTSGHPKPAMPVGQPRRSEQPPAHRRERRTGLGQDDRGRVVGSVSPRTGHRVVDARAARQYPVGVPARHARSRQGCHQRHLQGPARPGTHGGHTPPASGSTSCNASWLSPPRSGTTTTPPNPSSDPYSPTATDLGIVHLGVARRQPGAAGERCPVSARCGSDARDEVAAQGRRVGKPGSVGDGVDGQCGCLQQRSGPRNPLLE